MMILRQAFVRSRRITDKRQQTTSLYRKSKQNEAKEEEEENVRVKDFDHKKIII
jgi:hypothetical protein